MAMTNPNLMCVFDEPAQADGAINALEKAGFGADQIYYSSRPNTDNGFFASLRNLFTANNGDSNVSHDLKDLGLTSDEAEYYQQQHRAGHGIVAVQANGREQEALTILRSLGAHVYGTQNAPNQSSSYDETNATRADGDYQANRTDTYQNDQTYNNAGVGMGATPDQQDYSSAGTGAGAYQNDPGYSNTGIGAKSDQYQSSYGSAGTGAGMYQNDPADANNVASGAGTYQQQQSNDPRYNNAGTYQQQQSNDPRYNNAGTYQQQQSNDPTYNNAGTYQQQSNDPTYNNAGTGAGTYQQQNERDANTYADNRVGNEVAREQRRMGARDAQGDVPMDERARENYDANRNFDPNR